jgi:hypothetical protein
MSRRAARAGAIAIAAAATLAVAWLAIGRSGIEVESPRADQRVGIQGLDLLARFAEGGALEPATVRVLLNGADVTDQCSSGRNGVAGRLHGLLDGENRVRVEAFVRWPGGLLVQRGREVRVWYRSPQGFDRG